VVSSGATISNETITSGFTQDVLSGGNTISVTVGANGEQDVYGTASGTVILSDGSQYVYSGTASGTVIAGGYQGDYGSAVSTVVSSGGEQDVYGSASSTTVSSGGIEIVESGGYASGTTVLSGGEIVIYDGATVSGLTVSSGGSEVFVSSGGFFGPDAVQHGAVAQPSAPSSDPVSAAPERTASRATTVGSDSLRLSASDWQVLLRALGPEESSAPRNQAAAASPAMEATVANLVQAMASFHAGAAMGEGTLLDHVGSGTLTEESPPLARVHHPAYHA